MQNPKKRGASVGEGGSPNKRIRLEGTDAAGLGSQNLEKEDEEQEAERQQRSHGSKDVKFAFKV